MSIADKLPADQRAYIKAKVAGFPLLVKDQQVTVTSSLAPSKGTDKAA